MPVIRREFTSPFNRKEVDDRKRMRKESEAMGFEVPPTPQPPLPEPTNAASRPDLYPAFARGVASATSARVVPTWDRDVAGTNSQDVNNTPDDKVATSGADHADNLTPDQRKGSAERARKRGE